MPVNFYVGRKERNSGTEVEVLLVVFVFYCQNSGYSRTGIILVGVYYGATYSLSEARTRLRVCMRQDLTSVLIYAARKHPPAHRSFAVRESQEMSASREKNKTGWRPRNAEGRHERYTAVLSLSGLKKSIDGHMHAHHVAR